MDRSPNRLLGLGLGVVYLAIGGFGFTVTPGLAFSATKEALLFGLFGVNPLHNVIHLLVGAALVAGGLAGPRVARVVNEVTGTVLLVLGLASLFLIGTQVNVLAANAADNVLHFGSSAVLLAAGIGASQRVPRGAPAGRSAH